MRLQAGYAFEAGESSRDQPHGRFGQDPRGRRVADALGGLPVHYAADAAHDVAFALEGGDLVPIHEQPPLRFAAELEVGALHAFDSGDEPDARIDLPGRRRRHEGRHHIRPLDASERLDAERARDALDHDDQFELVDGREAPAFDENTVGEKDDTIDAGLAAFRPIVHVLVLVIPGRAEASPVAVAGVEGSPASARAKALL